MPADVGGESLTRHPADAGAYSLDADHQRECEERRPQYPVAEAGTDLGIRGDTARIIVRSSGDKTRSQPGPQRPLLYHTCQPGLANPKIGLFPIWQPAVVFVHVASFPFDCRRKLSFSMPRRMPFSISGDSARSGCCKLPMPGYRHKNAMDWHLLEQTISLHFQPIVARQLGSSSQRTPAKLCSSKPGNQRMAWTFIHRHGELQNGPLNALLTNPTK